MANHGSPALRQLGAALRTLLALTVILGLAYPLAMTVIARAAFPQQANGSLVREGGRVVGSELIGQRFADADGQPLPQYFQPRPSAGSYDPLASGASNLGPENRELVADVQRRRKDAAEHDGIPPHVVAPDALTASGSGLDPHISPTYAQQQVHRVARARGLPAARVRALVPLHTRGRPLGFLGEPTVDVLSLNLALDGLTGPSDSRGRS